jgi:hypothetical protein
MKKLLNFISGKKVYVFCVLVIILIPVVHFYIHPLSFDSMFFGECFFIYALLNRSTQSKIIGHSLKDYFR